MRKIIQCVNRSLLLFVVINAIAATTCASFKKKNAYIEPVKVVVIDDSRVENDKIRHIFRQYLVKELVDLGSEWLTVINAESLSDEIEYIAQIEYTINFDIMDFCIYNIESEENTLLAGIKIIDRRDNTIAASFIDNIYGKNTDCMCGGVANSLADKAVKTLTILRTREPAMPDVLTEPQDSLQTENQ